MAEHKIIKAKDLESSGVSVEKVNLGLRKFTHNVFKNVSLDNEPVAMEDEAPVPEFPDVEGAGSDVDGDEHQVRIERFYGDDGELTGLQITCRCGEIIDLEFTREEDETLPESPPQDSEPGIEQTDSGEVAEAADAVEEEQVLSEQEQNTVEDDPEQEIEDTRQEFEEKTAEEQILVDNEPETTEIEEN